jgi:hypothetical protein
LFVTPYSHLKNGAVQARGNIVALFFCLLRDEGTTLLPFVQAAPSDSRQLREIVLLYPLPLLENGMKQNKSSDGYVTVALFIELSPPQRILTFIKNTL